MEARTRYSITLLATSCALAFLVTLLTLRLFGFDARGLPANELNILRIVHRQVMENHVQEHTADDLLRKAIAGMVKGVDRYSAFVPPSEVAEFERETTGSYAGIGITLAPRVAPATVYYILSGGPAERAGLRVGDQIVRIDGDDTTGWGSDEVTARARERLLGAPGTPVRLGLRDQDGAERDVALERGAVQQHSVKWVRWLDRERGLGYVYVSTFQRRTPEELDAALALLGSERALEGLVLDLRGNTGGLLDECIAVTNRFLAEGVIVSLRKRGGVEVGSHVADPAKASHPGLRLVLLVDGDTASASEVLAGALQDHHRAQLVGTRTYGKGVVQSIYRWADLDFRLKLTTAHYYTPNGRCIEGHLGAPETREGPGGLVPDVVAALPTATVRDVRTRLAAYDIPAEQKVAARALATRLGFTPEADPLGPDADAQLGKAIAVLSEVRPPDAPKEGR